MVLIIHRDGNLKDCIQTIWRPVSIAILILSIASLIKTLAL